MEYKLKNNEFRRVSEFINTNYGIQLPETKKIMIESRLQKRLIKLDMESFSDYFDFIFSLNGRQELIHTIDLITTNKTDFFRESQHFNFLTEHILPHHNISTRLNVWSCGSSSGEEAYTLAMVLSEFSDALLFNILGTDICMKVLNQAKKGIYSEKDIGPVPMNLRRKYLLRHQTNPIIKINTKIKNHVRFDKLNLMNDNYNIVNKMDIVFFRNVAIYFSKQIQEEIINKICNRIKIGGYLFIGHSESLFSISAPIKQIATTIYKII